VNENENEHHIENKKYSDYKYYRESDDYKDNMILFSGFLFLFLSEYSKVMSLWSYLSKLSEILWKNKGLEI